MHHNEMSTLETLKRLIDPSHPEFQPSQWAPHRPSRPQRHGEDIPFKLAAPFTPSGDQPTAISALVKEINAGQRDQVLLGVTGSGKTYTIAQVILQTQRPAIVLAPNKILAAQLYGEFQQFFPNNAVEYFVSYYDYYQPEAYIPRSNTYIEKTSSINEQIDRMRHAATRALLERKDVIIIASVSCIYGIGGVESYTAFTPIVEVGKPYPRKQILADMVALHYKRSDDYLVRGSFRAKGDSIELFPAHLEDRAWRISLFGDDVETIVEFDPLTGRKTEELEKIKIYASSHYVIPRPTLNQAIKKIKQELKICSKEFTEQGRLLEAQRLEEKTLLDLEMIQATGSCPGIENYSRHLTGRMPGDPPPTLFEYLPDEVILIIDESHVTIPQIHAMFRGDLRRKSTLADFGFRLPSCMDNRPLRFEEWNQIRPQTIYVSATPGKWELEQTQGLFIEQVIRPTGLIDPQTEIRPAKTQIDDLLSEVRKLALLKKRCLVTTLTKKMAEDLTEYFHEHGVRIRYMHSDIDTLERIQIIQDLRLGLFDVLVGINLLREGLDIPECSLVAILDADKEGFLRSETSLIQTIGRAARNVEGRAILYADKVTGSMERALTETQRRREKQISYNKEYSIIPESINKEINEIIRYESKIKYKEKQQILQQDIYVDSNHIEKYIEKIEQKMKIEASNLNFEEAARLRDQIKKLRMNEIFPAGIPSTENKLSFTQKENSIAPQNRKTKKQKKD